MISGSERLSNNAQTTLTTGIGSGDTTLTVDNPSNFPTSGLFRIIIDSEILLVTIRTGAIFTVSRGAEGTSAASHATQAIVTHVLTKGSFYNAVGDNSLAELRLSFDPLHASPLVGSGNTLYAVPCGGNKISLYDNSETDWRNCPVPSSIPLGVTQSPSGMYDVFMYYDVPSTGVKLEQTAWTSLSARATGTDVIRQDGVLVRSDDASRRYLGTYLTTSPSYYGTYGADQPTRRFLWNMYNKTPKEFYLPFSFVGYTIGATPAGRPLNNDLSNRIEFIVGVSGESYANALVSDCVYTTINGTFYYTLGFAVDNVINVNGKITGAAWPYFGVAQVIGTHTDRPSHGYHYWQAMEGSNNTVTVYSNGTPPTYQTGIYGTLIA